LIAQIYFILFKKEFPILSTAAKKMISKVGHWYLDECATYIRVFGHTKAPYLLPYHVPNRLVVGKICYQTILQGYNPTLVKDNKQEFIPYGFHIGLYLVKDTSQGKQEGLSQLEFRVSTGQFRKNDPKGMVLQHASQVSSCWLYAHDKFIDEVFIENAQDWDEVVQRMVDPKMTKLRAMTLDEQATSIEQSTQEALRAREEIKAAEATEVQGRGVTMTLNAWERGLILIEQVQ
jgi:hypothetical protein